MTKKRRVFDIDLPEGEPPAEAPPAPPPARRGPMAAAIGETADTLRQRAEVEAQIRAENDGLAHEFVRLKKLGLITDLLPLDAIATTKLQRDRSRRLDPEVEDLKVSIAALGLSNPIRVEAVGAGRYELVEGWRRLTAYRALWQETGDPRWSQIPASLVPAGETVDSLYRRMVDENLIRKDISWAEMARLVLGYVQDRVGGCNDTDEAVNLLFASANPQKRSYIRRFALMMRHLEKVLEFPEEISRALGLAVAHRLEMDPASPAALVSRLRARPHRSAAEELAILRDFAESAGAPAMAAAPAPGPAVAARPGRGRPPQRRDKTTLQVDLGGAAVSCTVTAGKVELQLDRDLSRLGADRLQAAVRAFFAALDGRF